MFDDGVNIAARLEALTARRRLAVLRALNGLISSALASTCDGHASMFFACPE